MSDEIQGQPTFYRIAWQSKVTGVEDAGQWTSDRTLVQLLRDHLREIFKDADFWIEETCDLVDPAARMPGG